MANPNPSKAKLKPGAGRKCRRVIGRRHLIAAERMVVDGWSARRALLAAGYSESSARNFGDLLRNSWSLRAAIEQVQRENRLYPDPSKVKYRKPYQRKNLVENSLKYVGDTAAETRNEAQRIHEANAKAKAVAEGRRPWPCPKFPWHGPLERDRYCMQCEKSYGTRKCEVCGEWPDAHNWCINCDRRVI